MLERLPSSQASTPVRTAPSPHLAVTQLFRQASLFEMLPSSHCSAPCTVPSPHCGAHAPVVVDGVSVIVMLAVISFPSASVLSTTVNRKSPETGPCEELEEKRQEARSNGALNGLRATRPRVRVRTASVSWGAKSTPLTRFVHETALPEPTKPPGGFA